jgi:hypothetical protein
MKNLFTTKLYLLLAVFTFTTAIYAQETVEELPEIAIQMDFDKTLYAQNMGNTFMSEAPKAVLVGIVLPQSYEDIKAEMDKDNDPSLKDQKKVEFTDKGIKYMHFSGIYTQEGLEMYFEAICKKIDENSCIMITSMYEGAAKTRFEKEGKKAAISAVIVK